MVEVLVVVLQDCDAPDQTSRIYLPPMRVRDLDVRHKSHADVYCVLGNDFA